MSILRRRKDDDPSGIGESFWAAYYDQLSRSDPQFVALGSSHVAKLIKWFGQLNLPKPTNYQVACLLNSPLTQGDLARTFELVRYYQLSVDGLFLTNEGHDKLGRSIQYAGAENWENVMCYMDALLFAMFTNLDSFEPILFISNQAENSLVNRLSNLLRVYVNLLRSGHLIRTDLTQRICETLSKLGYKEAMSHHQQDSADLFEFLTETMMMPLLTFKIDIKHAGKFNKDDDQKYTRERILFVSIPEELDGESTDDDILLEECLEHYFNNSINVKRELERRATLESTKIPEDSDVIEVTDTHSDFDKNSARFEVRTRSSTLSIWSVSENESGPKPREVSLPAWMFLRLLPFYTDDNNVSISKNGNISNVARNSKEFANRRPVLPICLKRYNYSNSKANRSQKKVIIPPIISLPQFVADDDDDSSSGNYKLILESAICHRGTSISSGHFVAAVRCNYNKINETDDEAYNAMWYLYDDMKKSDKVVQKSFKEVYTTEWPYMLFYRLIEIDDTTANSSLKSAASSIVGHSKFTPPQGFKNSYWKDDPLTPIMSASNSPSLRSEPDPHLDSMLSHKTEPVSSPAPECLPTDPKYTDIKDKYYWYVPDADKNYYKEYPSTSRNNTREPSLTPQFRRNSQWSDHGHHAEKARSINVADLSREMETLQVERLQTHHSNTSSASFWSKSKNLFSSPKSSDSPLSRTISPIDLTSQEDINVAPEKSHAEGAKTPEKSHHHRHHHVFHKDDIHKAYKKSRRKRDAYKQDKCIIS